MILKLILAMVFVVAASAANILVIRPAGQTFVVVQKALVSELGDDHKITIREINKQTKLNDVQSAIKNFRPELIVAMDNKSIRLVAEVQQANHIFKKIPVVATMGLNLKKTLVDFENYCGVAYEVPAYTILTKYRKFSGKKLNTALVFYRGSNHAGLISDAKRQLKKENISLKAIDVEQYATTKKATTKWLKKNLQKQVKRSKADAVWVISDNVLLNKATFASAWIKTARKVKVPFVSGIQSFTNNKVKFCTFAAGPNHKELGSQVAGQVLAILEDDESPDDFGVEYIVAVELAVNKSLMKKFKIRKKRDQLANMLVN